MIVGRKKTLFSIDGTLNGSGLLNRSSHTCSSIFLMYRISGTDTKRADSFRTTQDESLRDKTDSAETLKDVRLRNSY